MLHVHRSPAGDLSGCWSGCGRLKPVVEFRLGAGVRRGIQIAQY
jgi:hypothetical protein